MSQDIRRRLAYFGPREKVYTTDDTEITGLPRAWRRILSMSTAFPVIGPFGCVYSDMEHALCAYRYLYTSNRPVYAHYFREEVSRMSPSSMCRRWGSANGMSLLMTDPNDRIWHIIRDRCMFDLVFQRVARDPVYRMILERLVDNQFVPVYHVRTAKDTTYWGATLDKDAVSNTQLDRSPKENSINALLDEADPLYSDPSSLLIGRNRLGFIMMDVLAAIRQFETAKTQPNPFWSSRLAGVVGDCPPDLTISPIASRNMRTPTPTMRHSTAPPPARFSVVVGTPYVPITRPRTCPHGAEEIESDNNDEEEEEDEDGDEANDPNADTLSISSDSLESLIAAGRAAADIDEDLPTDEDHTRQPHRQLYTLFDSSLPYAEAHAVHRPEYGFYYPREYL